MNGTRLNGTRWTLNWGCWVPLIVAFACGVLFLTGSVLAAQSIWDVVSEEVAQIPVPLHQRENESIPVDPVDNEGELEQQQEGYQDLPLDLVIPRDGSDGPAIPNSRWLEMFNEIDDFQDISRVGLQDRMFRFEVISGSTASGALVATSPGMITRARVVCDDICTGVQLLRADRTVPPVDIRDRFEVYVPPGVSPPPLPTGIQSHSFDAVTDWSFDNLFGASLDDVLVQWILRRPIEMGVGDMLIIQARDDEALLVNVGVTAPLEWQLFPDGVGK